VGGKTVLCTGGIIVDRLLPRVFAGRPFSALRSPETRARYGGSAEALAKAGTVGIIHII